MSAARLGVVFRSDLLHSFRRPIFWVWIIVLGFTAWSLSTGDMRISSGDAQVGGTKAWLTSEFSAAMMLSMVIFIFYMFFVAIASGMAVLRDEELHVGEFLHTTPLTPGEYIWGKFLAGVVSYLIVLSLHLALTIFFNHVFPSAIADEIRGPLHVINYVRPALVFGLPAILFFAGTTFLIGTWTRRAVLVFLVPVALLLFCGFFLWDWSPHWLDPKINRLLMLVEPAGFRWLNETWLKLDRGVEFYNTAPIGYDRGFLLSRLVIAAIGFLSVGVAQWRFARGLRGSRNAVRKRRFWSRSQTTQTETAAPTDISLAALGMRSGRPGFLATVLTIGRFEAKELWSSPGLYLFVPVILIQIIGTAVVRVGAFSTPLLNTPGVMAVSSMNTITLLVCLLLLFYTVESLNREENTGFDSLMYATPIGTSALLLGKALANAYVALVVLVGSFVACVIALLIQGKVGIELWPFFVSWVLVLVPTFLLWTTFVMAVQAAVGNRYTTYAVGLGILILTGYKQATHHMIWTFNWNVWAVERWSDFGTFALNKGPLILNRVLVLSLIPLLVMLTIKFLNRRRRDATRTVHRLRPQSVLLQLLKLLPFAVAPVTLGIVLYHQVQAGFQGDATEKFNKDYWKGNHETWNDVLLPLVLSVDVDVDIEPEQRRLRSFGEYVLFNHRDKPMRSVAMTALSGWDSLTWTRDGQPYEPRSKSGLHVIAMEPALAPGDTLRVGWRGISEVPKGATKNGGGVMEFICPTGVVVTGFSDAMMPILGYRDDIGVDDENRLEPKQYAPDFYVGYTPAGLGSDKPFTTRVRVTAPEEYTLNSVGTLLEQSVHDGKRTALWQSDHPVYFLNVVCGKWDVRRGEGTAIYYLPEHEYNIDEMIEALDASRRYYSEWFYEFPWSELKVSEFPDYANYAQGFPTNITFSEGIGFLTKSDPKANAAFLVTAHEAAHQWWGNILMPGDGPGGNILSEGTAHFSTILLFDQVKGLRDRMEFCKGIEVQYGDRRQVDSERPLVEVDGSRPGDTTVTYDKGGWVFWMLLNFMGRERGLAGYNEFIHEWAPGPDHAVLQDFVAVMRRHAEDEAAFDAFVQQWFFDVVVPEYRISDATKEPLGDSDPQRWQVRCRVENRGSGRMPVEIAATKGVRFPEEDEESPEPYAEARNEVVLGAGESTELSIECDFEPEQVLVDPDVLVLQLEREKAVAELESR